MGAIKNLANPDQIKISTNSLVEGIPPEEFHNYCDLIVQASYGRAIGTREGGYEGKKLMSAFQSAQLDVAGSDCGSKGYIEVTLTPKNKGFFEYRYMTDGTMLTSENMKDYMGKTVKLRSPMFCCGDKYCNRCFGDLYYMLGFENVGILSNRVGTRLLNLSLKAFHDLSLKIVEINLDDYIE